MFLNGINHVVIRPQASSSDRFLALGFRHSTLVHAVVYYALAVFLATQADGDDVVPVWLFVLQLHSIIGVQETHIPWSAGVGRHSSLAG